jgi:hypothetical protein
VDRRGAVVLDLVLSTDGARANGARPPAGFGQPASTAGSPSGRGSNASDAEFMQ